MSIELQTEPATGTDISTQIDQMPVLYSVSDAKIAEIRAKCALLKADTKQGYEEVRSAIATTRTLRVEVEKQREALKRPALDYGRRVDAEAKRLTIALEAIEKPLQIEKDKADAEKARIKREAEEAERKRVEAERQAQLEAERARIKAEQEAEAARLRAEREAEEARLKAERASPARSPRSGAPQDRRSPAGRTRTTRSRTSPHCRGAKGRPRKARSPTAGNRRRTQAVGVRRG